MATWKTDGVPRPLKDWRQAGATGLGIVWIDLDSPTQWEDVASALDEMALPGFERAMLGHLLTGIRPDDPGARTVDWYDPHVARGLRRGESSRPRYLGAFALKPEVSVGPWETAWVFVQPVEFLVSSTWLITSRRRGTAITTGAARASNAFPREDLVTFARRHWRRFSHPGDLAMVFVRTLVDSYTPALREVDRRLEDCELGFVRGVDDPKGGGTLSDTEYRSKLLEVKWIVDGVSRTLAKLSRPATDLRSAWFDLSDAVVQADQTQDLIERTTRTLGRQREDLRASFDLIASTQASEQLSLSRDAQERSDRFRGLIDFIAAVLLVPSLVAAFFGALPGVLSTHPEARFALVLGSMIVLGLVSFFGLRAYRKRSARSPMDAGPDCPKGGNPANRD